VTSQGVLTDDPAGYNVLVLCVGSAWTSAYTPAEVTRISSYVNGGGGLLIMADNPYTPNANLQPVATAFGITLGLSMYNGIASDMPQDNPLVEGVPYVQIYGAGAIEAALPSAAVLSNDVTGQTIAVMGTYGAGHVVAIGDSNLWDSFSYPDDYSRLFAVNTFNYLATPEPATLSLLTLGGLALLRRRGLNR
jgi:uncharacterized membrane protein